MLNLQEQEKILDLHRAGLNRLQISETTKVSWGSVNKIVKRGHAALPQKRTKNKYGIEGVCPHCGVKAPCIPCMKAHATPHKWEQYQKLLLDLKTEDYQRYLEVSKVA